MSNAFTESLSLEHIALAIAAAIAELLSVEYMALSVEYIALASVAAIAEQQYTTVGSFFVLSTNRFTLGCQMTLL